MDFLKKHYEKLLLGVMLAGLIGVLVFMLYYIRSDTADMEAKRNNLVNPPVHALTNLDMTVLELAAARARAPYGLDLDATNKLFNPMKWERTLDGNSMIPVATKTGPKVCVVTKISPLYTIISLDSVITNELGVRYVVKVEHQGAATPAKRRPVTHYVSKGEKGNADFTLVDVKGPVDNPDSLVLKLTDSDETVSISPSTPYRRADAYQADFRYDPEKKVFQGKRVGDKVWFGGVEYAVVEVNPKELVLADQSNQKKTSLPFAP